MPALDGLRGTAILLVLACHANLYSVWGSSLTARFGFLVFGAGWVGVDLFFVLSGFLITGILLATKGSNSYYRSFFARRFLRIFPLYYAFLLLLLIANYTIYSLADMASLLFYYYNLYAVAIGHHLPFVNSLWSLAVEEQFYLVWPILVACCGKKTLVRVCVGGILLALALRLMILPGSTSFQTAYYLTPCRLDDLLIGSLLAVWRSDKAVWHRVERWATPMLLLSGAVLLAIAAWTGHFMDYVLAANLSGFRHSSMIVVGPGITAMGLFFGALLVKCARQGRVQTIFLNWPLRRIGKYSYGMYMFHWLFLLALSQNVMNRIGDRLPAGSQPLLLFLLLLATTFAGAYASFAYYEKRFLSLKRFFPAENPIAAATQVNS